MSDEKRGMCNMYRIGLAAGLLVGHAILPAVAEAQAKGCRSVIAVSARAPNGANLVPPQTYDTQAVARQRALAAWRRTVAKGCAGSSSQWRNATARNIQCEGYAGGVSCEVSGKPGRRPRT
jgi:hypothetical protein